MSVDFVLKFEIWYVDGFQYFAVYSHSPGVLTFPLTLLYSLTPHVCCQGESLGMFNLIHPDGSVFPSP